MRILISTMLAVLAFCCAAPPASAQSNSLVVAVCGTLPLAYAPGAVRTDTIDVNGNKCTAGTVTITGVATAANQVLQLTQETAINTLLGLQADSACGTDNGACTLAALVKRLNQRLTTLNTTLGSPFQAGGSIGNTGFIANAGTNLNTSALALDATVGTTNTDLGAPGATACTTDTGSCSLNALAQRLAQRLTTVNTTLGTPFQAGASIGNTTFAATQSGTWTAQPGNTANTTPWLVTDTPSSASGAALTKSATQSAASNAVVKSGAGNLYGLTVTVGATAGWVMVFDATALPSNGATGSSMIWCYPVNSDGTKGGIDKEFNKPIPFTTGLTLGFSSTACNSLTASATAFFYGRVL